MIMALSFIMMLGIAVFAYIQQPKFGKTPSGERLEKIKKSPHYKNGAFQNLSITPLMTEGVSYFGVLKEFLFPRQRGRRF